MAISWLATTVTGYLIAQNGGYTIGHSTGIKVEFLRLLGLGHEIE